MSILKLIGRTEPLFEDDIASRRTELDSLVSNSRFLVIGGAGSIGQAVTREIFRRNPLALHVFDISENNMVELVRTSFTLANQSLVSLVFYHTVTQNVA